MVFRGEGGPSGEITDETLAAVQGVNPNAPDGVPAAGWTGSFAEMNANGFSEEVAGHSGGLNPGDYDYMSPVPVTEQHGGEFAQ